MALPCHKFEEVVFACRAAMDSDPDSDSGREELNGASGSSGAEWSGAEE